MVFSEKLEIVIVLIVCDIKVDVFATTLWTHSEVTIEKAAVKINKRVKISKIY